MNVLSIPVANAAALYAAGYRSIEIWSTPPLPQPIKLCEITSATALAATLTSDPANTLFNMGNFTLEIAVNGGAAQTVSFAGVLQYWTPTQVANQINLVIAGLATVVGESVVLTAPTTGRTSSVQIVSNTATDLGWAAGQTAIGYDARIALVGSQIIYPYTDLAGVNRQLYKWKFTNGSNLTSDFEPQGYPVEGSPPPLSTLSALTTLALAQFADLGGRPKRARILIGFDESPAQFGSSVSPLPSAVVGAGNQFKVYESDDNGFLQVQLVQGIQIRVAIEGTTYVRQITVPTGVATFDLLAAMAAAPDQFTVQEPLPFLIRQHI